MSWFKFKKKPVRIKTFSDLYESFVLILIFAGAAAALIFAVLSASVVWVIGHFLFGAW